jgi:hypothetical protein
MALVSVAGLTVLEGSITYPYQGAWTSTLVVEGKTAPTGRVSVDAPGMALSGTVVSGGSAYSRTSVRIVGGAGNLSRSVGPRWWRNAPLRLPVGSALDEAGEMLSTASDEAVLAHTLAAWTRGEGRAAREMDALTYSAGAVWRVRDDGTVWVGIDTWTDLDLSHHVTEVDVAGRYREIATSTYSVRPGMTLDGFKIVSVTYRITAEKVRVEIHGL